MSQVWAWPSLVSGRDQFCMCQMVVRGRRGICQNRWKRDVWGTGGIYSSEPRGTRGGASRGEWYNSSRDETSMIMYKLKEGMEKSYSDLLAIHQRKYIHGRTEIL
jgi:hypothetical protein